MSETSTDLVASDGTVIPDGIEPVEAWRSWNLTGRGLVSLNHGILWPAGKHLQATCPGLVGHAISATYISHRTEYRWCVKREPGMKLEKARQLDAECRGNPHCFISSPIPEFHLPLGSFYHLEEKKPEPHHAPMVGCTCGLYAGTSLDMCPQGQVWGKVKLWGKVIPGSQGFRAEFGYPSELWTTPDLVADKRLAAYGVPVHSSDEEGAPNWKSAQKLTTVGNQMALMSQIGPQLFAKTGRIRRRMVVAMWVNLGFAATNLSMLAFHLL